MKVLLIEDNPGDARLVKEMLAEAEGGPYQVQWSESLLEGLDQLSQGQYDVAILDLSLPDSAGLDTFTTVRSHAPRIPLVLMTGVDNDALALRAVEMGAQDYLVKGTLAGDALARTLRYAVLRHHQQAPPEEAAAARIIGMVGAKGGVGTTTFTCHFAVEWRRQTGHRTLLMDLDADSGSAAFLLKSNSRCSILDASTSLHRLDAQLWNGMVWTAKEGIDLIQPPGHVRLGDRLSGDRLRHVMRFLRKLYDVIVVDLGRFNALTIAIINEVQDLFLITTPDVQALYEAKRVLRDVAGYGVHSSRVNLVLNRRNRHALISRPEVETALGVRACAQLPECGQELEEAYSEGGLLREGSPLLAVIGETAARIHGLPLKSSEPRRRRFFGYSLTR